MHMLQKHVVRRNVAEDDIVILSGMNVVDE